MSVFIQSYNFADYIAECIESVLNLQDPAAFEIIIIDDASSDKSAEIARQFKDPRIRLVVHERNMGAAATLNEGIDSCRGDWIARIDGDDRYRSNFLTLAKSAIELNPSAIAVYGKIAMMNSQGHITSIETARGLPLAAHCGDRFLDLLQDNFLSAPTLLAKAEAWKRSIPVPHDMPFCDWYCALRIAEYGHIAFTNQIHADYRVHEQGMHVQMMRDGWGEKIYWRVLDKFFTEPTRSAEKSKIKRETYGKWAEKVADDLFGVSRMRDARRCYAMAIKLLPFKVNKLRLVRLWIATFLNPKTYNALKRLFRFGN